MDAIILAAGLGTRLRPHTLTAPKPLLPVRGRPILDWTFSALPASVDRVIVVVNYLAEKIEEFLANQKRFTEWVTVRQSVPRGTGDALRSCQEEIRSERFLVINGDDLYGAADLAALASTSAGVLVYPVDDPQHWGIVFPTPNGTIERLVEKPKGLSGPHMANTGVYLFPRTVFEHELQLSPRGEYEITDYVSYLIAREPVRAVPAKFWFPIGNVEAWEKAQELNL
jgi:bifunctional UDP-N-acetylglucosamine pyrophosphorylase/glucosamine-1-phosphate N-acetyltransferase